MLAANPCIARGQRKTSLKNGSKIKFEVFPKLSLLKEYVTIFENNQK